MSYELRPTRSFEKAARRLDEQIRNRIAARAAELMAEPRPTGGLQVKGNRGRWRIRIGKFRLIYEIDDGARIVTLIDIDNRDSAYREQ